MKIDVLIPASPNDNFYSQIAMVRLALDSLGGVYRDARVVAVLGDKAVVPLPDKWAPYFERIDVVWTDPADFAAMGYHGTGLHCFEACREDADVVVLCDADTLPMRPFPELLMRITQFPAFAGVLANFHIPWELSSGDAAEDWGRIAEAILGRRIALPHRYLFEPERPCPFYVNWGFMAGPAALVCRIGERFRTIWPAVNQYLGNYFSSQVAITLVVNDLGIPTSTLPRRYNFANYTEQDRRYPEEYDNIVIFHYFSTDFFNRHRIFTSRARFDKFLGLELTGSNRIFQDRVRAITGETYPFPGAESSPNRLEDAYDDLQANLGRLGRYAKGLEQALKESQAYSLRLEQTVETLRGELAARRDARPSSRPARSGRID